MKSRLVIAVPLAAVAANRGHRMTHEPAPSAFYRAEDYHAEASVTYLMRRVVASIGQAVDGRFESVGLTNAQWVPLLKLHQGRGRTVAELARECAADAGATTRMLDRLEAKGLVRRVRSTEDRRVVNLELTEDGARAAERIPAVLCEVQNAHLAGFTAPEWQALKGYLHRMLENGRALHARPAAGTADAGKPIDEAKDV